MNLALSALLIILLLLPAFFFRIGISMPIRKDYLLDNKTNLIGSNVSKVFSKLNFTETVFLFSIIPVFLHFVSLLIIKIFHCKIDFGLLLNVFSGKDDVLNMEAMQFEVKLISFLVYTFIQAFIAFLLGLLLVYNFGSKPWLFRLLMGNNIWYKLFSGMLLSPDQRNELSFIVVEVLAMTKESSMIYTGWLKCYDVIEQTDNLAYITMTDAIRRDLRSNQLTYKNTDTAPTTTTVSYDSNSGGTMIIPSHNFTIPGKEIVSIGITYMKYNDVEGTNERIPVPIREPVSIL
ncbi:hypothetical protein SAMN05518672_102142 [Chitinophaga sp. CF118]|uniref:hypothetical protein n=1 Tax=Chitinophaga sp. CF118 TaxID=1884367 RepID=UPI0008F052E8|nr:hypothetical protein [Chitinophaga sp. CF118]SFD48648.1 hypothetical protein SAMN05518672_102142 [Chitinophaga sp. CF118]